MIRIAVATSSTLAAEAAAEVAEAGGNAVDCAVAAALLAMNTEPGVCALAGGAFVTIWPASGDAITIDGNVAVPGHGKRNVDKKAAAESVTMEYGGGIRTLVGAASVAVPGSLAALDLAARDFGLVGWKILFAPSIRAARSGFPLPAACHHYLQYSGKPVFSRSKTGFQALHTEAGELRAAASNIVVPGLADSLELIANEGSRCFYTGELAQRLAQHVQAGGGLLSVDDLHDYKPIVRAALRMDINDWSIATNPPPAIGGTMLCAMLLSFLDKRFDEWNTAALQHLINVQHATLSYRADVLDVSDDVRNDAEALLTLARRGTLPGHFTSGSTVHTSVVDSFGLACAITASAGYGSGEMPQGTGLWLNNCMGELELNHRGLDAGPAGSRLPSNMAPTIARKGNKVLAVGSPGADRITTALHQFLINFVQMGMSLSEAVNQPRIHLELGGPDPVLAVEPGVQLPATSVRVKRFMEKGMYFGGVGAALYEPLQGFTVAADPRRVGGTFISST